MKRKRGQKIHLPPKNLRHKVRRNPYVQYTDGYKNQKFLYGKGRT